MKSMIIRLVLTCAALFMCVAMRMIKASVGCMDTKYYSECSVDDCIPKKGKKLLYVACSCPCTSISITAGTCKRCGHYGNPERGAINALQKLEYSFYQ
jgi:hypothetical protein